MKGKLSLYIAPNASATLSLLIIVCYKLWFVVFVVFGVRMGRGVPIFEEKWNYYLTYSFLQVQLSVIMGIPFQDFLFQR